MTESSVGIGSTSPTLPETDKTKPGASGVLLPNMQARIVEPDSGRNLPLGQSGEILLAMALEVSPSFAS